MSTLASQVDSFLTNTPIAVAGVSRQESEAANLIFRKLKEHGYAVFPTNPKAAEVEGEPCFPTLKAIPEQVKAVIIAAPPAAADEIVRECAQIGVHHVWFHRSFGTGSVSDQAVAYCHEHDIETIVGGCPMMFIEPDVAHRCMKWVLQITGKLPA